MDTGPDDVWGGAGVSWMRSSLWEIKQGDAIEVLKTMPEQSVHYV